MLWPVPNHRAMAKNFTEKFIVKNYLVIDILRKKTNKSSCETNNQPNAKKNESKCHDWIIFWNDPFSPRFRSSFRSVAVRRFRPGSPGQMENLHWSRRIAKSSNPVSSSSSTWYCLALKLSLFDFQIWVALIEFEIASRWSRGMISA